MSVNALRDAHVGETAWIVGRGPSLTHLRADHIGPGPVLAMNDAIVVVDSLALPNPVYSLQNDGARIPTCGVRITNEACERSALCWDATLLGLRGPCEMVVRVAVELAKRMGCTSAVMVCCDSLTTGDLRTWTRDGIDPEPDHLVAIVRSLVVADLAKMPHSFVTPESE